MGRSEGGEKEPVDGGAVAHTQVPWCAGGSALRLFKDCDLSLKSDGFCCETSTRALATISPEEGKGAMLLHLLGFPTILPPTPATGADMQV